MRIITFRISNNQMIWTQQEIQPFFYDGFSVASGNSHKWKIELFSIANRSLLQRFQRIFNDNEIRFFVYMFWNIFDYKIANAFCNQLFQIQMRIVILSFDSKKQSVISILQRTAVYRNVSCGKLSRISVKNAFTKRNNMSKVEIQFIDYRLFACLQFQHL